jgi:hypothetical protein
MKKLYPLTLFFAVLIYYPNSVNAQALDIDAEGNRTLLLQGAGITTDVAKGQFAASFYNVPDNKYHKRSSIFGINALGQHRNGISGLLNNGFDATSYRFFFTAGLAFTTEYPAKLKSLTAYEQMLREEKEYWFEDSIEKFNDTIVVFGEIDEIAKEHPVLADSLKQIYLESGPTRVTIKEWKSYAKRIKEKEDNIGFSNKVKKLIVNFNFGYVEDNYKRTLKYYDKIKQQLSVINLPPKPYSQTNLFVDFGVNGTSFKQATFIPLTNGPDSNVSFNTANFSNIYFGAGINHFTSSKINFGVKFGIIGNDNFEELNQLQYDSVIPVNRGNNQAKQTYSGYYGTYKTGLDPYLSLSLSYIDEIDKLGHILVTPVYVTLSRRTSYGTSISILTKSKFLIGVSVDGVSIDANAFYDGSPSYTNYSFGFKLGYFLPSSNFLR